MRAANRNVFFLLFALSGFSGLIYESIWTHYLKLFLGHAAYAQTLVLAIFMGGMALGSWISGRYSARWKNLLLGYAMAEGAIGVFALIFHQLFNSLMNFSYQSIIPGLASPFAVNLYKWLVSALMILPQSMLLGMTFPLMTAGVLRLFPREPGKTIALLYFTNSIGAAAGVLTSGFLMVRLLGLPGTIAIAGVINLALAATVWLLARERQAALAAEIPAGEGELSEAPAAANRMLLLVSFLTGAASFIYEIGWIRMLSLVLGSSTHAFELMLSAFIFGLACGGFWIQRRIDRISHPVRFLAMMQLAMGMLALATLPVYGQSFEVMQWILNSLQKTSAGYAFFNLSSNAIALAVMLPATFCAGTTLPLITYLLLKGGKGEGSIGSVYAANTVGAICGVFFAVHLGMPLLGLKGLIACGATIDMALGLALIWSVSKTVQQRRVSAGVAAGAFGFLALILLLVRLDPYKMASGVYRDGLLMSRENSSLIYHRDGKTATVSLNAAGDRMSIRTNGKIDATVVMDPKVPTNYDENTMVLTAVIPNALHPAARTVANIGLGSGLTTHTLLGNPAISGVDTVEIEMGMVEAARHFGSRVERVYKDPRSRIYIDDAKTFFAAHNKKYDMIISEPSNPWVSGVAGLFSEEFYQLVQRYLNDKGLLVQWMQLYEINPTLVASVLKAVSANFTDYAVYAPDDGDILIVARKGGTIGEIDSGILEIPAIAQSLDRIKVSGRQDLEIRKIGGKKMLDNLLQSIEIAPNSDYYPVLDQNAARARFLQSSAQELISFIYDPLPVAEMLGGEGRSFQQTEITPTRYFPKSVYAFRAMALRDYLLSGSFKATGDDVPEKLKLEALQLNRLFSACGSVPEQDERTRIIFNNFFVMIPHLKPEEMDLIWKKLESGSCAGNLSGSDSNLIALFKAVGRRDAGGMVAAARTLRADRQGVAPELLKYATAAEMLGLLAQEKRQEARELWRANLAPIYGKRQPDMLFRLLAAHAVGK